MHIHRQRRHQRLLGALVAFEELGREAAVAIITSLAPWTWVPRA
jgi:hypothetical protein